MWYVGASNSIINLDYMKRIYICKKEEFDLMGYSRLRDFVLCGTDAGNDKPTILKSYDSFEEADLEMARLLKLLRMKE